MRRITLDEYEESALNVLDDANAGRPTQIVDSKGVVIMTVGVEDRRYFPDPDPDPLEQIHDV